MSIKVGILTITDYGNYGNRLQNYATQEVLKKNGFEVTTVKSKVGNQVEKSMQEKLKNLKLSDIPNIIKNRKFNKKYAEVKQLRYTKFVNFSNSYINETNYTISEKNIPNDLNDQFNYFVTGSDQVWNPNYRKGSGIDFLTFAPPYKRVALSPSFGISEIPEEYKHTYKKMISEMASLSVREEAGANIIKQLTNRDAEVLVDPTLMLSQDEWNRIASKPSILPEKNFVLTYFLGPVSEKTSHFLDKISREKNLEIINLHNLHKSPEYYSVDPSEFLYLVKNASLFCTDSFHGSIFSIVFKTPFIIFDRIENNHLKMSSRIDTLLKKFKLSDRHESKGLSKALEDIMQMPTNHIDDILSVEQAKYNQYINQAINYDKKSLQK